MRGAEEALRMTAEEQDALVKVTRPWRVAERERRRHLRGHKMSGGTPKGSTASFVHGTSMQQHCRPACCAAVGRSAVLFASDYIIFSDRCASSVSLAAPSLMLTLVVAFAGR